MNKKRMLSAFLALVVMIGMFAVPVHGKAVKASGVEKITFEKRDGK